MYLRILVVFLIIMNSCKTKNVILINRCIDETISYGKLEIKKLIENPKSFDGKSVEIEGVYYFGFEESSLVSNSDYQDCVNVHTTYDNELNKKIDGLESGVKIRLKGVIDLKLKGHMNSCAVGLKNICYFEVLN